MKDFRVPLYLQSTCPYDERIESHIEELNGCVYLYMMRRTVGEEREVYSICWLCNTVKAPKKFKARAMKKGLPSPMMRVFCDHPDGMMPPAVDSLESFWTEKDMILVSGNEVLAVVTDYASAEPCCYTKHVVFRSPYGAPLKDLPESAVAVIEKNGYLIS